MTRRRVRTPATDFRELRMSLHLTAKAIAELLGVNPQTVRNWELGRHRVPYSAFRLLRVLRAYELPGTGWDGWIVRDGALWSPAGQRFDPAGLSWLSLTFRRADAFTEARQQLQALRSATRQQVAICNV